jgi:hypothetical protein
LKIRSIGIRGLIAAPLVVGGGIAALALSVPKLVREQIASRVQARVGLHAEVGDVSFGFGSVTIDQVSVGGSGAPSVHARGIMLDAGPLTLALRGSRALGAVQVEDLRVELPLHTPATHEVFEKLLEKRGSNEAAPSAQVHSPALNVQHIALEMSDAGGTLAKLSGGRVITSGDTVQLAIDRIDLGDEHAGKAELERIAVTAKRGAQGLQLSRASLAQARVWLAQPIAQDPTKEGKSEDVEDVVEDDAPSADDAAPAAQAAKPEAPPKNNWQRIARAIRNALPPKDAASTAAKPALTGAAATSNAPAWLARLSDDAVLSLDAATVYDESNKGKPVLDKLKGTLKMQSGHTLAFAGSGGAQAGGAISWDLSVTPESLRADGQVALRSLPLSLLAPFLPNVPWYEPENGRVDAELVIKTDPEHGVIWNGDASLRDAAISSARIAPEPVTDIDVSLRGNGKLLPLQHRLEIEQAQLALKDAAMNVAGVMEWSSDHYLFDVDAVLPPTPCTKAIRAIPADLLGDMALAEWKGKFAGHVRVKLDSRDLDKTELVIAPEDHCDFVAVPAMADLRRFREPFVHSVVEPDDSVFEMETGPGTANWTSLEDINPFFVHAVLAHEDGGFFTHHGFSLRHIREALVRNLKEGRYVVGASTITMQLVKNVFLHREKTLARKIQEVLLTWWIERVMEKRDIIELYLNVIEYGPSVYGIRNGAKHYFNRLPSQLSPAESVYLATILPNPKKYHTAFERGSLSTSWISQMRQMLLRLKERGSYSQEATDYGLHEIEDFHFHPEGTIVPPRTLPGGAAVLPYLQALSGQAGWGEDDAAFDRPASNAAAAPRTAQPTPPAAPRPNTPARSLQQAHTARP